MECLETHVFDVRILPQRTGSIDIMAAAQEAHTQSIRNGVYIKHITDVALEYDSAKIHQDGSVLYIVRCKCNVTNPKINETYRLAITGSNKMGAVFKDGLVTVFVPKHYCTDSVIPDVDSVHDIKIVGRRVDGRILCIGTLILT